MTVRKDKIPIEERKKVAPTHGMKEKTERIAGAEQPTAVIQPQEAQAETAGTEKKKISHEQRSDILNQVFFEGEGAIIKSCV